MKKLVMAISLAVLLAASANYASAEVHGSSYDSAYDKATGTKIILDVVLLRPLGMAAFAVGTGFFVAGLPFAVITGSVDTTAKALIKKPFTYTFVRKLGED
ncbi:MAG: hypothetical protein BMS9Abin23_0033 [Thermodesulfobacteriota bacterium]|nr:MAG: hypothetical protein BMS9Abin23_0033 [Thermodesulfobacteriota bacterium]